MGRRPLPAVRDCTRDGRWSTYDVNVLKKMGGKMRTDRTPSQAPITTKLARLGHFPPASQAGRLAGLVFYVYVFSLGICIAPQCLNVIEDQAINTLMHKAGPQEW
jgi:hypothetical protein